MATFERLCGPSPPWFVDALALAVTSGRVQRRKLYTDDSVRERGARAAIAVTSRTAPFARADVSERALPLFSTEFRDGMRRLDSQLDREVAEERSGMRRWICRRQEDRQPSA